MEFTTQLSSLSDIVRTHFASNQTLTLANKVATVFSMRIVSISLLTPTK